MEQAKEKVLIFIFFGFPLFCEIIFFDPDWERRFKKQFKEYLRYLYRYGVFFVTYGTSKKE
jgi:hypothetical protein